MSNFHATLKIEIARLARRAMRPVYAPMRRDVVALKRALADQKRLTARLARDNARLVADLNTRLAAPPTASADEVKRARLSSRLIKSQRARLGLSRGAFAKLVGVSGGAVLAWEGGRSKPRAAQALEQSNVIVSPARTRRANAMIALPCPRISAR